MSPETSIFCPKCSARNHFRAVQCWVCHTAFTNSTPAQPDPSQAPQPSGGGEGLTVFVVILAVFGVLISLTFMGTPLFWAIMMGAVLSSFTFSNLGQGQKLIHAFAIIGGLGLLLFGLLFVTCGGMIMLKS